MAVFQIPVINLPQSFQISLGGIDYILTCKYNAQPDAGWVLDFYDADTNEPIVFNIPLVTGINLLDGLNYLGFAGELYVTTDGDEFAVPTLENLGVESFLFFQTED